MANDKRKKATDNYKFKKFGNLIDKTEKRKNEDINFELWEFINKI